MGQLMSCVAPSTSPETSHDRLDIRLAETLKARVADTKQERASWTKIVLNFKKINMSFQKVRDIFMEFDVDRSNAIDLGELQSVLKKMGCAENVNLEEVKDIFLSADRSNTNTLNQKEFLVCLAICYLLKIIPEAPKGSENNLNFEEVFGLVVDAFLAFDEDASGFIERDEVMAMFAKNERSMKRSQTKAARAVKNAQSTSVIGQQRWQQMDWDKDGAITFKEFLFAFSTWTGMDDDNA